MNNRRLVLMVLAVFVLAGLLWLDQGTEDASTPGVVEAVQRPALPTTPVQTAPARHRGRSDDQTAVAAALGEASRDDRSPATPSLNPLAKITLDQLSATVEQPLFEMTRQAYQPPPPPAPPAAAPRAPAPRAPPPDPTYFSLAGISASKDRSIALLKQKATGRQLRVEAGEVVEGWSVEKITEREVTLSKQGVQVILRLSRKPQT